MTEETQLRLELLEAKFDVKFAQQETKFAHKFLQMSKLLEEAAELLYDMAQEIEVLKSNVSV